MDKWVTIGLIATGCFVVGCVTLLTALGKDSSPVTYLLAVVVPTMLGNLASYRQSAKAKQAAETAASTSVDAAENAAAFSAQHEQLQAELSRLQARIGGRRADDRGIAQ